MSSKKQQSNQGPLDSTRLLKNSKQNYLSSDNNSGLSVAGVGCAQSSDDYMSEHQNRNKKKRAPDNSMYRTHNNPHLISSNFNQYNDRQNRYYRRKKHSKSFKNSQNDDTQPPPNMPYPQYFPYPYPYPPPYPPPYPYPYPTVPAHGDVAITQSFTPPPVRHHNRLKSKQSRHNVDVPSHQIPPYYYYPSPYYPPPQNQASNVPYPYNMHPYGPYVGPPPYGIPERAKRGKRDKKRFENDEQLLQDYDDDTKVENAEPAEDDVSSGNKLFSDLGNDGYENDATPHRHKTAEVELDLDPEMDIYDTYHSSFASQKSSKMRESSPDKDGANCLKLCVLLCDMENAFEVIEILILFVFIAFIAVWWVDRDDIVVLLSLAGCAGFFGLLVMNMRRAQSSLRLHELGSTLNDFRFLLFTIGICVVIVSDQMRNYAAPAYEHEEKGYLWFSHTFVWIIAGMLWCTIDFAAYMSYFVSAAYHMFIFIGTVLELAKVCYQIWDPHNVARTLYEHNDVKYTLFEFKIDGLLLMLMAELSTIITLVRDRKREWYCFGLSHVYRHRLLQISPRQERIVNERMVQLHGSTMGMGSIGSSHLVHNVSGNRYFYMFGSNEDSLLLIWIINLGLITYLTFFLWDAHSAYKSIPAAVAILSFIILLHRECDFHLVGLIKQQTHFWFLLSAMLELWFVTIYSSIYVDRNNKEELWKEIASFFIDSTMLSMGMILIFATDLLISSVSSYFIIRGTIPVQMLSISAFSIWYLSFESVSIKAISWPIAIVIRNGYFILITMCLVSIVKWIRDPIHKYFIFILDRRKRTILYEHRYRDDPHSSKLLFNEHTRDHSVTTTTQMAHSSRSLLAPSYIAASDNSHTYNQQYTFHENRMQRLTRNKSRHSHQRR